MMSVKITASKQCSYSTFELFWCFFSHHRCHDQGLKKIPKVHWSMTSEHQESTGPETNSTGPEYRNGGNKIC